MGEVDVEQVLDNAQAGMIEEIQATLMSEESLTIGEYPGQNLAMETDQFKIRCRIMMVGNQLYQLLVIVDKSDDFSVEVDRFLNSFTVLKEEIAAAETSPASQSITNGNRPTHFSGG